jgi:hypothetical protein
MQRIGEVGALGVPIHRMTNGFGGLNDGVFGL